MDAHTAWALVGLLAVVVGFVSLISIIYPLRFLRIRTRRQAALLTLLSLIMIGFAAARTPPAAKLATATGAEQPAQAVGVAAIAPQPPPWSPRASPF